MKKLFIVLSLLVLASPALAKPQIVAWQWPTSDCDGGIITQADLIESELIFDTVSMPMPSDTAGACDPTPDPGAPAGATVVPIDVTTSSVILNLQPGQTYYARINVTAYVAGNRSSWSDEYTFMVPYGRPNKIIIGKGLNRMEYMLIEDPIIYLKS